MSPVILCTKASLSNVSTAAKPTPFTVHPPQPATPLTSKKVSVVVTAIHELHITIATKESIKDRGALLSDIRKEIKLLPSTCIINYPNIRIYMK